MSLAWLSVGSGPTKLPEPWRCFDREVDVRKALPFGDASAQYILAEHLIEHLHLRDGMRFLCECRRVLAPGGILRLSFPDVTRIDQFCAGYLNFIRGLGKNAETRLDAVRFILADSGHVSMWTAAGARQVLRACGFSQVVPQSYGHGSTQALMGVDRHHQTSTLAVAIYETTVLEAMK